MRLLRAEIDSGSWDADFGHVAAKHFWIGPTGEVSVDRPCRAFRRTPASHTDHEPVLSRSRPHLKPSTGSLIAIDTIQNSLTHGEPVRGGIMRWWQAKLAAAL